jgi:hypothetical protein
LVAVAGKLSASWGAAVNGPIPPGPAANTVPVEMLNLRGKP